MNELIIAALSRPCVPKQLKQFESSLNNGSFPFSYWLTNSPNFWRSYSSWVSFNTYRCKISFIYLIFAWSPLFYAEIAFFILFSIWVTIFVQREIDSYFYSRSVFVWRTFLLYAWNYILKSLMWLFISSIICLEFIFVSSVFFLSSFDI